MNLRLRARRRERIANPLYTRFHNSSPNLDEELFVEELAIQLLDGGEQGVGHHGHADLGELL